MYLLLLFCFFFCVFLFSCFFFFKQSVCEASNVDPCGDKGICIPDYSKDSFTCKCHNGYGGIRCGKVSPPPPPPFRALQSLLPPSLWMESDWLRLKVVSSSVNICQFQFVLNLSLFRKQSLNSESKAFSKSMRRTFSKYKWGLVWIILQMLWKPNFMLLLLYRVRWKLIFC